MAFIQRISLMITSLIILHTIPSTTSIAPDPSTTSVAPDPPTMILIDGICLQTVNPYYCEQSIIPKLDTPHSEITTIAKIAAFNAFYNSKETIGLIRDEFIPKADKPLTKAQLRTCIGAYNGVERLVEGAYRAVVQNQYSEMRRYQANVLGLLDQCKADFDLMLRKNWWVRLYINISIFAARRLPAL